MFVGNFMACYSLPPSVRYANQTFSLQNLIITITMGESQK